MNWTELWQWDKTKLQMSIIQGHMFQETRVKWEQREMRFFLSSSHIVLRNKGVERIQKNFRKGNEGKILRFIVNIDGTQTVEVVQARWRRVSQFIAGTDNIIHCMINLKMEVEVWSGWKKEFRFYCLQFSSVQFSSVAQSCLTLRDPMNHSTPGLPVHHQLPEFTQTHVHWVSDAIQPSHPLSSPSPPAPNPSQHQSLVQWVNSSHEVAKVLEFQL